MITNRFFKLPQAIVLIFLALCSLASYAGTISVMPTTADGGTAGLNVTSYTKLFYNIKNSGSTNLTITAVTSSAAEFSIEQPTAAMLPVTIAPGGTYLISALFKPGSPGAHSGTITIASDDPNNPTITVTATGYGGIEQSIRLAPAVSFEIEVNQGLDIRANVTFDNGARGVALLHWTSANPAVAGVTAGADNLLFGTAVPTGKVTALGLGSTTLSVSGVTNPNAQATIDVTIVPVSSFEFLATAAPDRVVRVKDGAWSLCYDFPETDIDNRPVYNTNQIGVTTPNFNTIGNAYVTAKLASDTTSPSELMFYISGCNQRTTVYDQPLSQAAFRDLAVDSAGNAVATTDNGFWKVTPTGSSLIPRTGLPANDVGALAFDHFDNLYVASYIKTTTTQAAAVYVLPPFGTTSWVPIAVVFNGLIPWSEGILGLAVDSTKGNSIYLMKNSVSRDRALIDRYIDLNGDGSYFKLIGSTIVADPGEIFEIAAIDAGLGLTLDARANIVASVAANEGRSVVKLTDKNNDGDFKDPGELRVIYQSTPFTQLKDIAFAAPCRDPNIIPYTIPSNGVGEIGEFVTIGVAVSACDEPIQYEWRDETGKLFCTAATCQYLCTGLPAVHKLSLKTTGSTGNSNTRIVTVKCGPPKVYGFWPGSGVTNTAIFLFGKNFQMAPGTLPANPVVKFNNGALIAPISQVVEPDLLFALQPSGATAGSIEVCTAIGCARTSHYYNSPSPGVKVMGIWRSEVKVGNLVFVFGQSFSTLQGANKITVNGLSAPIVQPLDSTLLFFMVPPGATTGPVCITVQSYPARCSYNNLVILP